LDAETLRRAIEPFFSTKEVGKGTGLGLSMIHGLAQQLKGALRLSSEVGRGTCAELWLPVAAGDAAAPAGDVAAAAAPGRRGATLLLVDDDFLIRMSTASLLEDLGYVVLKAASGAEALEALKAGAKIDLLVTDYAMPGMTGLQLAEKARALHPGLPILLATGYADLPARSALDVPRLSKPYRQSELAQVIDTLLR
jgi:CheY-like chemotaxis protein